MGFNFAKTCFQAASGVCGSLKRGLRLGSIGFSGCLLFFAWGLGQQLAENGVDAEGDAYPVGELLVAERGGGFQVEHAVHDAAFPCQQRNTVGTNFWFHNSILRIIFDTVSIQSTIIINMQIISPASGYRKLLKYKLNKKPIPVPVKIPMSAESRTFVSTA